MTIDDEDSKVRRNLVAAAAAVILVSFMEIPLSGYIEMAIKAPGWNPRPWRVWLAVSVVLFYLALRYRFTEYHKAILDALNEAYRQQLPGIAYTLVTGELARLSIHRNTTELGFDGAALAHEFSQRASESIGPITNIELLGAQWEEQRTPFEGSMKADLVAWGDGRSQYQGQIYVPYKIAGWKQWRCRGKAWFHSWIYSKEAVVHLVPTLLALGAAFIASFRLASELH